MGIFVLRMSSFIRLRYCPFEETLQSVIIYFTKIKLTFTVFIRKFLFQYYIQDFSSIKSLLRFILHG